MRDMRPKEYRYWNQLMKYTQNNVELFFNGNLVYPRQFEIHLPGNHKVPCDLRCPHCAGKFFIKALGTWELDGLTILNKLQGKIPYHIYGGAYTEPTINPYLMAFLATTKKYGNHFGIHTNGVHLMNLETNFGWLTELCRIATDKTDYLSVSIDAGLSWSWAMTKGTKQHYKFFDIVSGLKTAIDIRRKTNHGPAIRLCYLISPDSGSIENFGSIVNMAKYIGVDSLRFSIPFGSYNKDFDEIREYKNKMEVPADIIYRKQLKQYLSNSESDVPYIFYTGPEFTDIDRYNFKQCLYGYYQITYGADGYAYKCSTTATPTVKMCRLGKITGDLGKFNQMIMKNQNPKWNAHKCFKKRARCNRMGLEINCKWEDIK